MVSHCPNCKDIEMMLPIGIRLQRVKNTELVRLCNDSVCCHCGVGYRESCLPTKGQLPGKVTRDRIDFQSPKYKDKVQIARRKLHDRNMYAAWLDIIFEMEQSAREQLNSRTYSDYACHALYTWVFFLLLTRNILKKRIETVDLYMKGEASGND